jgi:hypothetical protein
MAFESYLLIPGSHTFLILDGIPETFGLDAELAYSVRGHQSAMRIGDKVNSHSILSNLCFPKVPVPSDD